MGVRFDKDFATRLELKLRQVGERAVRGGSQALEQGAEDVQQLAIDMAPYDPTHGGGHLWQAIKVEKGRDDSTRRNSFTVFVDGSATGKNGHDVGSYAILMHEFLSPYGDVPIYHARAGTLAKGPQAGGKFLARAFMELKQKIVNDMTARVRAAIRLGHL